MDQATPKLSSHQSWFVRFNVYSLILDVVTVALLVGLHALILCRFGSEAALVEFFRVWLQETSFFSLTLAMTVNLVIPGFFFACVLIEQPQRSGSNAVALTGTILMGFGIAMLGVTGDVSIVVAHGAKRGWSVLLALFAAAMVFGWVVSAWEARDGAARKKALRLALPLSSVAMAVVITINLHLFVAVGLLLMDEFPDYHQYPKAFMIFHLIITGFLPVRIGYMVGGSQGLFNTLFALASVGTYVYYAVGLIDSIL